MKLTNSQVISLAEAHLNLDGVPEKPFLFSPKFRYSLVKNLRLLQQHVRDIEKTRVKIIQEIAPANLRIENDSPEAIQFNTRYNHFMEGHTDIPLMGLKLSDFNLDKNDIAVRVLSALGPIIVEDTDFA